MARKVSQRIDDAGIVDVIFQVSFTQLLGPVKSMNGLFVKFIGKPFDQFIRDHLLELNTFLRGVTGYDFIGVPPKNSVAFAIGKLLNFLSLLFRTCLLLVGRHAYVGNCGNHRVRLQVEGKQFLFIVWSEFPGAVSGILPR